MKPKTKLLGLNISKNKTSLASERPVQEHRFKIRSWFLICAAAFLLAVAPSRAGNFFWEPEGWDGTGNVPSGTWAQFASNWAKQQDTGYLHYQPWDNLGAAYFCYMGVSAPTNTYTLNIPEGEFVQVQEMVCQAGHPVVTGGQLFLYADTRWITVNSNLTFTINVTLTNNMAGQFTLGLIKCGMGTLELGATNYIHNTNGLAGAFVVEGGTLKLTVPGALGLTNKLILANGAIAGASGPPLTSLNSSNTPATFNTGGQNQNLGTLRVTGPNPAIARTIDFNNGQGALSFQDSSAEDWNLQVPAPRVSVALAGQDVSLTWAAVEGATYRVLYRDTIVSAESQLGTNIITAGPVATAGDSLGAGSRFYRVEVVPTAIPLIITNYSQGTTTLRFGTNSVGLTAAQLSALRFANYGNRPGVIDANGFITPAAP